MDFGGCIEKERERERRIWVCEFCPFHFHFLRRLLFLSYTESGLTDHLPHCGLSCRAAVACTLLTRSSRPKQSNGMISERDFTPERMGESRRDCVEGTTKEPLWET